MQSTLGAPPSSPRQDAGVPRKDFIKKPPPVREVQISGEAIRLGQLLKLAGVAGSGGEGKALARAGVLVNGAAEQRRGRQLRDGDSVEVAGELLLVRTAIP